MGSLTWTLNRHRLEGMETKTSLPTYNDELDVPYDVFLARVDELKRSGLPSLGLPSPSLPLEAQERIDKAVVDCCEIAFVGFNVLGRGWFHQLARLSGLSRSTVSGVLQGKRGASLDTLRKLSEASGVELGRLAEYVENQRSQRKGRNMK